MVLISDGEYQYEYDDFLKAFPTSSNGSSLNSSDLIDNMAPRSAAETKTQQTQGTESFAGASLTVGSGQPLPPPPVSATPPVVTPLPAPTKSPVKIAGPQYVEFKNDGVGDQDFLKILFFENINGIALLSLVNSASLETANIQYQPILNMAETQSALDPKTLLALQDTLDKYFLQFPIKLPRTIPSLGNGPNGEHVYLDFATGNLTIDVINLGLAENIEIQTLQNGTIYSTNLGNEES